MLMLLLLLLVATSECIWSASPPAIMTPFLSWSETLPCRTSTVCIAVACGGAAACCIWSATTPSSKRLERPPLPAGVHLGGGVEILRLEKGALLHFGRLAQGSAEQPTTNSRFPNPSDHQANVLAAAGGSSKLLG